MTGDELAMMRRYLAERDVADSRAKDWQARAVAAETALAATRQAAQEVLDEWGTDDWIRPTFEATLAALRAALGVPDQPNPTPRICTSGADHHRPHPFVPGRDIDDPDYRSDEWCNTCGESQRVPDQPNPGGADT